MIKMTKKQNKKSCCLNLVTAVIKLMKKNVPSLTFFEFKGELKLVGSCSMSRWFKDLSEDLKEDLRLRMVSDIVNISDKGEELLINTENVPETVSATNLFKSLTEAVHPASGVRPLPFPLSLMSKKEKGRYVNHLIKADSKEKKAKIEYGAENCRPEFWLEEIWSWSSLKKSLFLVDEKTYTGEGTWTQFLTKTIQAVFEARSLDPETHVEDLHLKKETLVKKKRFHGVHEAPSLVVHQSSTERVEFESQPGSIITIPLDDLISNNTELELSEHNFDLSKSSSKGAEIVYVSHPHEGGRIPGDAGRPGEDVQVNQECDRAVVGEKELTPEVEQMDILDNEQINFQSLTSELFEECFSCQSPPLAEIAFCQAGHRLCKECIEFSVKDMLATGGGMVVRCMGQCDREVQVDQLSKVLEPDVVSEYVSARNVQLLKSGQEFQDSSPAHSNITETDLKPRRKVNKSPFKSPSHFPNHRGGKVKIPMGRMSEKSACESLASKFSKVPAEFSDSLVGCVQQFNSGGGSCLYKAAAQHCSKYCLLPSYVSYKDLRNYAHFKLMEWWGHFSNHFAWPMTVTIGTGEHSRRREILNESEYFKFLMSEESLESFSESSVDIWVLSYILNTTVGILSYHLPNGQGDGNRCGWRYFDGKLNMTSIYACQAEPLFLLNEHLCHYTRLVSVEEAEQSSQKVLSERQEEVSSSVKRKKEAHHCPSPRAKLFKLNSKVSKKALAKSNDRNPTKSSGKGADTVDDSHPHEGGRVPGDAGRTQEPGEGVQVNRVCDRAVVGEKELITEVKQIEQQILSDTPSNHTHKAKKVIRKVRSCSRKEAGTVNGSYPREGVPGHAGGPKVPDKGVGHVRNKSKINGVEAGEKGNKKAENVKTCGKTVGKVHRSDGEKARLVKGRVKSGGKLNDPKRNRKTADIKDEKRDEVKYLSKSYQVGSNIKDIFDEEIANKSDMYNVFVLKQKSVWEVIEPPSSEDIFEEERLEAQSREMSERKKKFEAIEKEIDESIADEKARQVQREKRMVANKLRRNQLEAELSQPLLRHLLVKNKEYFEKIVKREVQSYRFKAYFESGVTRSALRFLQISNPFTEEQISLCIEEIKEMLQTSFKELTETEEFVNSVMLPECLIKIYGDYFEVNKEEAEKMISETPLHAVDDSSAGESSGDDEQ